ncbi:MAG: class I SAM-dependent methyltransferase [Parcubacteria group bacterium]|jgi:SAM-dependent methyltransferase
MKEKKFPESALAHKYLDGLKGLEIGGSAHNPFGLNTQNIDYTEEETVFKREELEMRGDFLKVDIVAQGDDLPIEDNSQDFVINSHVLEHFSDPIKALKEWYRVVREGGYIFIIVPHKERTFDRKNPITTTEELIKRHKTGIFPVPKSNHYSFWVTESLLDLIEVIDLNWKVIDFQDVDDKVGNGFTIVIKKEKRDLEKDKVINSKIKEFRKIKEKENKSLLKILKIKRAKELFLNTFREFKKHGLVGIWKRIPYMYKWDRK